MSELTLDKPVLVLVENDRTSTLPQMSEASGRLLHLARTLTSSSIHALSIDPSPDGAHMAAAGADIIYVPNAPGYAPQVPAAVADAASAVLDRGDFGAILLTSNYLGRAVTGMLGIASRVGAAVDVTEVEVEGDSLLARKSALGGSWTTAFRVTRGFPVLALRPGSGPGEGPAGAGEIVDLGFSLSEGAKRVQVRSSQSEMPGSRVALADANVVVVGGRGAEDDFSVVEDLADVLGGAVGATRVVCDEELAPRSAQIGQTGLTIAPDLYVGLGVSGAVHHTCGMMGSETIVAVVDDPDAPILELADFAVIGDVNEVVPQALEVLRARLA